MVRKDEVTYIPGELVPLGFPVDPYHAELFRGDLAYELTLEFGYEGMGEPGNGWDDPGSGPIVYVVTESVTIDPPIDSFLPLTQEQCEWLELHYAGSPACHGFIESQGFDDYDL